MRRRRRTGNEAPAQLILARLQQVIENAAPPVLLRIARRRVFGDFLFERTVGAPVERAAFMDRVERIDDSRGDRKVETGRDAVRWAVDATAERGAGEVLITSMDRDGTGEGYDLALVRAIADAVRVPVVASGGAGTLDHFAEAFIEGHADAVLAASRLHFGRLAIHDVKEHLRERGIEVRP